MNNDSLSQQQQQSSTTESFSASDTNTRSFLESYTPPPGVYDENVDAHGQLRAHWNELGHWLSQSGAEGMQRRWKQIRRMVHQHGIAFSAYGDPSAREQHLQLDPLPQLIPSKQWESIQNGLKQRAALLNMLLADLYGPQTLLTSGVLPPEILFKHPHYQLAFHGLPVAGGTYLHFYAAELARSSTGDCWVMVDRTDSPGGSGFALENRVVISRAFPTEFRRCNVQRLAPYFIALREHLASLAPRNKENPHIAILSAGAGSASYFEDAYLARYLGFTLVEAADLIVRRNRVMFKTLSGLVPIDVIMRRQHSNNLDPLELRSNAPGITGILQVARAGNVAIASAPGSGLVESPIFMAFMPRISRALLQTDLMLPGVATWWGGEKTSLELILDKIDTLALLPAFRRRTLPGKPRPTLVTATLSRDERIKMVRQDPHAWVAQEKLARSSAAVWEDGRLRSGHLSLRTFLVASEDSYHVMTGGLSRVAESPDAPTFNAFQGGGTKDAWVLADKPVEQITLLKQSGEQLNPIRGSGYLSSRLADNFCWLGRCLERTDASARLLRAVVARFTGESDPAESRELPLLVRALAAEGRVDAGFAIEDINPRLSDLDRSLGACMLDPNESGSLRSLVDQVYFLATKVRERLSTDAWRIVQKIRDGFEVSEPASYDLAELLEITNDLIVDLAAFNGLISESMTRTHAFRFLNLGRRMEHPLQLISLIKNTCANQRLISNELLESLLEISDSIMTYRSRYYANLQLSAVLDLLLVDETNPRSLAYQLVALNMNIESLPGNAGNTQLSKERRLAMDVLHWVRMAELSELCELHALGDHRHLFDWLNRIEEQIPKISTAVSNRFLVHSGPVHQFVSDHIEEQ